MKPVYKVLALSFQTLLIHDWQTPTKPKRKILWELTNVTLSNNVYIYIWKLFDFNLWLWSCSLSSSGQICTRQGLAAYKPLVWVVWLCSPCKQTLKGLLIPLFIYLLIDLLVSHFTSLEACSKARIFESTCEALNPKITVGPRSNCDWSKNRLPV